MIFALDSDVIVFRDNVQENIDTLFRTFGGNFIIKSGDIELPSVLEKMYNSDYWYIHFDGKDDNQELLYPYSIIFGDNFTHERNNNCLLANIHKSRNLSGTDIMKIIIKFMQKINVENVYLSDGTKVSCDENNKFDLSLFKLIEKGKTFYQRFGFKFIPKSLWEKIIFKNENTVNRELSICLENINRLTCREIKKYYDDMCDIIRDIQRERDFDVTKIFTWNPTSHPKIVESEYYIESANNEQKCDELLKIYTELSNLLDEDMLFRDFIIRAFNDKTSCRVYSILEKNIIKSMNPSLVVCIEYKSRRVILSLLSDFFMLQTLRSMGFILNLKTQEQVGGNKNSYANKHKKYERKINMLLGCKKI
jgi:hypothetical protein